MIRRNNKKGMTLIELIAAMLVFTVIATTVTTVLVSITKVYIKANDLAESNLLLDNLSAELMEDLTSATDIEFSDTINDAKALTVVTGKGKTVYDFNSEGYLTRDYGSGPVLVLDKGYYKNKTAGVSYGYADASPLTNGSIQKAEMLFTLTIYTDDNGTSIPMVSRTYAVKPLGLSLNN